MNKPLTISNIMGVLMVLSSVLTCVMTPTARIVGLQDKLDLEHIIPGTFGSWRIEPATTATIINPDVQGLIIKIYEQTLSRTYINNKGERIMLSIAYGSNQSTDMHIHRPEICYAANGFEISHKIKTFVVTSKGRIPVMRMVAKQGARSEPITYWVRVGDSLTRGWLEQKLTAIAYGLARKIPDGLLFRVSTISNNEQDSYRIQQEFVVALLQAVPIKDRFWLVGQLSL
jgi:EpsI family protein